MRNSVVEHDDYPLVVGVDLGGTQIRAGVLKGNVLLSRAGLPLGKETVPGRIIPLIYDIVRRVLNEAKIEIDQIIGIGIGVPGPIDSRSGIIFSLPNLSGWEDIPLRDIFIEHYCMPVVIENDANAAALGEYLFGAGRGCKHMVYLTISTGIGGSVIVDGKFMRGISGTAAELGHMTIDWHGEHCICGGIGCLESIASGTAIAQRATNAIAEGLGEELLPWATILSEENEPVYDHKTTAAPERLYSIDAKGVAQAAAMGVPLACEVIRDAATALGVGLVNIIHLFNPELIVLGGGVTLMGPPLREPALEVMKRRSMRVPCKAVRVVPAQLGADVGIIGAGALNFLSD